MVIKHNLSALNANRQLGIVKNSLAKTTEKLSSGYKINRAADDAAGLSISEKMRKQIRGLSQASENIEDGISLCQIADGALHETSDILQRMNELAIQAANGINSVNDRKDIQQEINQLSTEIDRISDTTYFNEWVYPLKSGNVKNSISWEFPKGVYIQDFQMVFNPPSIADVDGIRYDNRFSSSPITVMGTCLGYKKEISGRTQYSYFYQQEASSNPGDDLNNSLHSFFNNPSVGTKNYLGGFAIESVKSSDFRVEEGTDYFYINSKFTGNRIYFAANDTEFFSTTDLSTLPNTAEIIKGKTISKQANTSIYIQSTDETYRGLKIKLVDASMKGLFSNSPDISVLDENSCSETINKVKGAIHIVSGYRSYFGAVQNRLEHAYNINENTVENTQYAESKIRDTDMASEMVRNSNCNILAQVGQSMLAQANQSQQGVLSLIA